MAKTEQIGVNPIRKYPQDIRKTAVRPVAVQLDASACHKQWVNYLDCEMQDRAEQALENEIEQKAFFKRVNFVHAV